MDGDITSEVDGDITDEEDNEEPATINGDVIIFAVASQVKSSLLLGPDFAELACFPSRL